MDHLSSDRIDWQDAPPDHFTGAVRFGSHYAPQDPDDLNVLGVHFDPGARTDWHSHPGGQVLYVTEGAGYVVTESGERAAITAGDAVYAPPGELHWHGARENSHMIHLSLTWRGATQWVGRKVTDAEYGG